MSRYEVAADRGRAAVARDHRRDQRHPRRKAARARRSSPRAASATCWSCGARRAPISTTCSRTRRRPSSRAAGGSRSPSASAPTAPSSRRSPRTRSMRLIAALKAARVEAIAVSLLFSFLNPEHERRLGARLRAALPDVPVYLSSDVLPEIKEFERTSTTAVCAYVGPILASYLERLEQVDTQPRAAAALSDGIERRHPRSGRGHRHAGHGGGVGPRSRRRGGGAGGAPDRASRPALVRHGRHHRQGEPDPRGPV